MAVPRLLFGSLVCVCALVVFLSIKVSVKMTEGEILIGIELDSPQHHFFQHNATDTKATSTAPMTKNDAQKQAMDKQQVINKKDVQSVTSSTTKKSVSKTLHDSKTNNDTRAWPPLESILQGKNITGDPQFLLDFAILGFPKAGTSTMMKWLNQHPDGHCFQREVHDLMRVRPGNLIRKLYKEFPPGFHYKRGYKNPPDIEQRHVRRQLAQYWPRTRIFVGIRHPIKWFESFYNFRVNNYDSMPAANKLIGVCTKEKKGCCADRAKFHVHLAQLGKTSMTSPEEVHMKRRHRKYFRTNTTRFPNPIFIFTTEQLADQNETRMNVFRKDVQDFVGFERDMPPMLHMKPGRKWSVEKQAKKDAKKIDICHSNYTELRRVLMNTARPASVWLRKFFIEATDVYVSSKEYFNEILETWMHDPCDNSTTTR